MLTNDEAEYLLNLKKSLVEPRQVVDLKKKKNRLNLISYEDSTYQFWIEITTNQKILLKTSIHHLESNSFIGLLRIDFKGGHKNPADIQETLPDYLHPYADKWFEPNQPHLHVYVEGYKPLAWAIPLNATNFPTKTISHPSDISDLITNFAKEVNVISRLNIQHAIL